MKKKIQYQIGPQLILVFSTVFIISTVALIFLSKHQIEKFGNFSTHISEKVIRTNTAAFMARVTHEQSMRYESVFENAVLSSKIIAKNAGTYLEQQAFYGGKTKTPGQELFCHSENGIFSNKPSARIMVLYWGASKISQQIEREIKALYHIEPTLESIHENIAISTACYVVTASGHAHYYPNRHSVVKLPSPSKFDIRNSAWYSIVKPENNPQRETRWTNIYQDSVGQGLMITASTPVYDQNGFFLGAAGVDIALNVIAEDVLDEIPSPHKLKDSFSFLVNKQGELIAFPPYLPELFEIKINHDSLKEASSILEQGIFDSTSDDIKRIGQSMLEKPYQISTVKLKKENFVFSSHIVPSTQWRLGVVVPEASILSSVTAIREELGSAEKKMVNNIILMTAFFWILSLVLIIVFLFRFLISPLSILSESALRVKAGDLSTHISTTLKNEIGSLSNIFNEMVAALQKSKKREAQYTANLEQAIKRKTNELRDKNAELNKALEKMQQEILQRQKVELNLRESEKKLKNIVENSTNLFYSHTVDNEITYISPKCREFLQCEPEEARIYWTEFTTNAPMNKKGLNLTLKAIATGEPQPPYELEIKGKKGKIIIVEVRESPIQVDGKTVAIVGSLTDITERKKAEANQKKLQDQLLQIQKIESIGTLAGGIAHDFNNILFPIIGMSELLIEDLPQGSLEKENAEEIYKAGKRGGDLVKQILAFSRQSEHKMIPTRIQNIVEEAIKLSRSTIPAYIEIKHDIQQDCGMVRVNPTQIHQICMNIITNAYHALENNSGTISFILKQQTLETPQLIDINLSPGTYAMLSISDTGCGMSKELIGKIFQPYFTTKERGKGTGLGLAVVYGIVKDHQGAIKVYSEVGKGSTFKIYLPLMKKNNNIEKTKVADNYQGRNEHILLVDDEKSIAKLERQMLERLGYKVTERNSSMDALEAFKLYPDSFDLVLTDMAMPHMTGDQLAYEVRQIKPEIPIIICTGFSERINEKKAQEIGVNSFLMKPIVKYDMARTVRKVLDESEKK